ncbi:phosphotransferase [Granulicella aggregans]|uniref:phosphotransferase n=1 Tax=Granulicella aggregans TaxID=474949 RepID=UPI00160D8B13
MDIPDTVLHGDLNVDNILFAGTHCVFIDWSEAYVGNPLVTYEHLLLLNQIEDPSLKASCNRHLRTTYLKAMSSICDFRVLEDALPFAPIIAAASTILGRKDWLQTRERSDPRKFPLVRAIARHLDRAAQAPSLLRAFLV